MAVIEYARNVLDLSNANSTEMDKKTPHPVISLMEDQKEITNKGGTMRLGSWECKIKDKTKVHKIYNTKTVFERHRHRWELNDKYINQLDKNGFKASGINPETGLVEIVELSSNDWFIGVQFHPEYKSTVECPHPLFVSFVKACLKYRKSK